MHSRVVDVDFLSFRLTFVEGWALCLRACWTMVLGVGYGVCYADAHVMYPSITAIALCPLLFILGGTAGTKVATVGHVFVWGIM